jgi:radical SAM protein with 4Fe4S-binding SPASM domain
VIENGGDIYAEMNRRAVPYAVNLELTSACTLDCIHCYHVLTRGPEMTAPEVSNVLDRLAELGTMELTLTGGEPLTRADFPEILRYAAETRGFSVQIFSNLTLLDERLADSIASLPIRRVETTILGPDAVLHDALTRRPGSFDDALRGIGMLRERGVRVSAKTIVLRENLHSVEDMYALAARLDIPFRHDDGVFVESDGGRGPLAHRISGGDSARLRKRFGAGAPKEKPRPCNAAKSVMSIGPDGAVYPCGPFPRAAGSVRETPLEVIWRESPVMLRVRSLDEGAYRACVECRYEPRCGGCLAMGMTFAEGRSYPCMLSRKTMRRSG